MKLARWLFILPAAIAAWYAVFITGMFVYTAVERVACPPADFVSGYCMNERVQLALEITVHVFVALAAIAVVVATVITAPSHKVAVAWAAFVIGSNAAVLFAFAANAYSQGASAIAAGLATTFFLVRRERARTLRPKCDPCHNAAADLH